MDGQMNLVWIVGSMGMIAAVGVVYLFQKGKLVKYPRLGRWIGRIIWWPALPFSLARAYWSGGSAFSEVDESILLGRVVMPWDVSELKSLRVTGVVNMLDEWAGPVASYNQAGIVQLRLPTVDHSEPSLKDLQTAVRFIHEQRLRGGRVLVHCRAGHGRSAAVAMAWLLDIRHDLRPEDAQAILSRARSVRKSLYLQPNITQFYQTHCT